MCIRDRATKDHSLHSGQSLWVYAVTGTLTLTVGGLSRTLSEGESLALLNTSPQALPLAIQADLDAHVVLIEAEPLRECFVQKGPFVMSTLEDLTRANRELCQWPDGRAAVKHFITRTYYLQQEKHHENTRDPRQ